MSVWPRAEPGEIPPGAPVRQSRPAGQRPPARWAAVAAWAVAGLILFACYWRLSWAVAGNSDGAGNALQAWDMLPGNPLLHGRKPVDGSVQTPELPEKLPF